MSDRERLADKLGMGEHWDSELLALVALERIEALEGSRLADSNEERLERAARALLAAAYDPIKTQANWPDIHQLGPMARERLMGITALAVSIVPAGTDDAYLLTRLAEIRDAISSS